MRHSSFRSQESRKLAVALEYKPESKDDAPRVVALGKGDIAERLSAMAKEAGIPVVQDSDLAHILSAVDIGAEIPAESFFAVAEILRYVYMLTSRSMPVVE